MCRPHPKRRRNGQRKAKTDIKVQEKARVEMKATVKGRKYTTDAFLSFHHLERLRKQTKEGWNNLIPPVSHRPLMLFWLHWGRSQSTQWPHRQPDPKKGLFIHLGVPKVKMRAKRTINMQLAPVWRPVIEAFKVNQGWRCPHLHIKRTLAFRCFVEDTSDHLGFWYFSLCFVSLSHQVESYCWQKAISYISVKHEAPMGTWWGRWRNLDAFQYLMVVWMQPKKMNKSRQWDPHEFISFISSAEILSQKNCSRR